MIHSAYMLKAMCRIIVGLCAKAAVRKRHGSDFPSAGTKAMSLVRPGTTFCPRKTAAHRPMMVSVTSGRPTATCPPKTVRPCLTCLAPCATQSTHWMPTAAGRWHCGQVGRPQRWHRT